MSQRILVTLDLTKISKEKIVPRSYENRDNETVTTKDYKIEVVPLREPQLLKTGDGWKLFKTHFVVEALSDEERAEKKKGKALGDGLMFVKEEDLDEFFESL